ncbi:uncharacterized protein LOC8072851 isoform X2 [Sorghum bicolor]|nr:uncharacterized protein LOC8072851 isoform X2 [Sorghum bicolor]|eukprot:XP_021304986.1 uncharacterized protein LOC8072851 isoform X2 [Sorghum bicolor]
MEGKDDFAPSTTVPKMTASSARNGLQHGASKVTTGSSKNLSTPMVSQVISKQPLLNRTLAGASSVKSPSNPSAVLLPTGSADFKKQIVVNGSDSTQNRESNQSGHHTTSANQSSLQSSCEAEKSVDKKGPAVHPVTSSVVMGYQDPKKKLPIQRQSIFSNHKAIAKNVERILHRPANHSSWTVPSTEYMNTRLDCQICKVANMNMESLLVCDACERGMHLKCLQYYGNQGLPKTEWYCPTCVAHCKGKPLPPKYGKVTRTIVALKTCMIGGAQPSHVGAENPTETGGTSCSKNLARNGSVINQNTNKVGSHVCKSGTLDLDAGSKSASISGAEPQKENVKYQETSSVEKEGNSVPCGGMPTETATLYNGDQTNRASTYGSGNLSGGSHMHIKSNSANPVNYSNRQSTEPSGLKHTYHSFIVSSVETCESTRTPFRHPSENVQLPSTRTSTDEIHQADGVTKDGIGKPRKLKIMADDTVTNHDNAHQVTSNGHIYSKHEIVGDCNDRYVGCSTASIVGWVGDGLKSIDNKTYYNSCNIDGIIYSLHDHILIAIEGNKCSPCKLQSLWEDHDSGSRLAMVNPYLLGSDLPQSISKPCVEEDEVYGSNDERTVLVSTICGPCEVLHADKFREESKRRCQLDSSGCRLHPIFFCRWNYDESTSSLYKDYNVDN